MIYELKKEEFYKCNHLVSEDSAEAVAIIEGENPGRIFVDNEDRPTTGLIWHKSLDIGFDFIGDPFNKNFNQEIVPFVDEHIKSEAKKIGMRWFEVSAKHSDWDRTVREIFKHKDLQYDEQHIFILPASEDLIPLEIELLSDYKLVEISEELLGLNKLENSSFLNQNILEFWGSIDHFFDKGVGYGIVHNNKIVSLCFSAYVTSKYAVAGVETIEEYRGKNFAQIVTEAYVQGCFRRGLIPYWDCTEDNIPSQAVAKKLGFNKIGTYNVHYFKF